MLDAFKVLEVHAKVTAEEREGSEEDGDERNDGHVGVGTSTCKWKS